VKNDDRETIADVSTDEFVRVMVTNALSPLRVVEALKALVPAAGTVAVMSSGQGSVANNITGGYEVCCNTSTISAESSPGEACCLRHNRMSATEVYETIGPGRRRRC
jgi:NAD(P)-dependent dehydrogenase (short-subunit alcohol dehydrogenase family)